MVDTPTSVVGANGLSIIIIIIINRGLPRLNNDNYYFVKRVFDHSILQDQLEYTHEPINIKMRLLLILIY